jgi:hypothetical protein
LKLYATKLNGASTPPQITLYCRLLRIGNVSPLDRLPLHLLLSRR